MDMYCPGIKFKIIPMDELTKITNVHLNQVTRAENYSVSHQLLQGLILAFTPDRVIYNNCMNETVTISDIVERVKLDVNYAPYLKLVQSRNWYNKCEFN